MSLTAMTVMTAAYHAGTRCRHLLSTVSCNSNLFLIDTNRIRSLKRVLTYQNLALIAHPRFAPSRNTRGHCYKLFAEQSTHNVRYYFLPDVLLVRGIDSLSILAFLL